MTEACGCFCLPTPAKTSCLVTYPYLQLAALNTGVHLPMNPVAGSVVCSAFPTYAPLTWQGPNGLLYVQATGPLVCDVWKSNPITNTTGTFTDTLTISSKAPGGVVFVRAYSSHSITGFSGTITYTNNYDLDTNAGDAVIDPLNPYSARLPYGFQLTPFGLDAEPDWDLVDTYAPFFDRLPCTINISVPSDATTAIMGTTYTHADFTVSGTVEVSGPHRIYENAGGSNVLVGSGSGAVIGSVSSDYTATATVGGLSDFSSPPLPWRSAVSSGGVYRGDLTSNAIALAFPDTADHPNSINSGGATIYFSFGGNARFILSRSLGATSLELTGRASARNDGANTASELDSGITYTKSHDSVWPGAEVDIPNVDAHDVSVLRRKFPDVRPGVYRLGEFKLRMTDATVSLLGVY